MNKIQKKLSSGFTLIELIMVLTIMAVLAAIVFSSFIKWRDSNSLSKDTETIISVLRQARNQTLSSKNSSVYGVRFATTTVTLFAGTNYSVSTTTNKVFNLGKGNILTITLAGNGKDVVFQRLTGETSQNGTVVISSPRLTTIKTITIYKTGVTETN